MSPVLCPDGVGGAAAFLYGRIALTDLLKCKKYKEQYYVDIGTCLADDRRNKTRTA